MPSLVRHWLHQFVPSHFRDPVGLTRRLLRTGDPAALFAIQTAVMGLLATPLDLLLGIVERRRYARATAPQVPIIFICGAPRSGTTLVEQVLIEHLPVAFLNNLTAIFPRAPLTANQLFRPGTPASRDDYHSYYGKTFGLSGPNDALYLWDRWLGSDRTRVRVSLTPEEQADMRRFFGAMEQTFGKPILVKNNNLNACASLVADVLEQAVFICMTRDPCFLAQSLLLGRVDIHGREDHPYGLSTRSVEGSADAVEDVCRQVLYHAWVAREQQNRIGPRRFRIVAYEAFCRDPSGLVETVAAEVLNLPPAAAAKRIPPFEVSDRIRIDPARFGQIAATLARLGHPCSSARRTEYPD